MGRDDAGPFAVRVATRGSTLARRQTDLIVRLLQEKHPGTAFVVKTMQTPGDRIQDRPISQIGDKGVFVRAIERALLEGEVDLAVHSLKDVPSEVETAGLQLAAFSPREDARDVLVSRFGSGLAALPSGARLGTGSLRRRVQLHALRPDLSVVEMRGNVDTRLRKLDQGECDALVLAAAGLLRLGLAERITEELSPEQVVPGAGQGILAVQTRAGDWVVDLVRAIDDPDSHDAALAERAVVRGLGADCHSPVGAYARIQDDRVVVRAMAAREDGSRLEYGEEEGPRSSAGELGRMLGERLLRLMQG